MVYNYICVAVFTYAFVIRARAHPQHVDEELEKLDEIYDNEIYNAIISSVATWNKLHGHARIKREEPRVCYENVGCFDESYLGMLPATPKEVDTKFMLYPSHSRRRSAPQFGDFSFNDLNSSATWIKQGFNNTLPTKVIVHGFGSDCSHIWVYEMKSALMAVDDVNVICVDWRQGAALPNYVKATANTRLVGKQVAIFLRKLIRELGFSPRRMHLIGFSLGAHVAGFAGSDLAQTNETLSRITGLDPAGPLYEAHPKEYRLDPSDAEFVDVIHSNGEQLIMGGFGTSQPLGHVDFFPNGGKNQTGCANAIVGAVTDIFLASPFESRSLCNHRRAYKLFTDSISPLCHFPAFPCESYENYLAGKCFPCNEKWQCGNMGYYADRSKARGKLYLITREEEPFCAHQIQIRLESSPSDVTIITYGTLEVTLIGDTLLNETFKLTNKDDEELVLGRPVSKMLVPHPLSREPLQIQVKYTAYTGWLTSGLTQWKLDKIILIDSFGRSSSVCKKNLILDTGVPVILPLYPGECNIPNITDSEVAEDRIDERTKNITSDSHKKFVPIPVKISETTKRNTSSKPVNSFANEEFDIFKLTWNHENNVIDGEGEQSRAFNTRIVKVSRPSKNASSENYTIEREIVEPILKPHSSKNGRSHDPSRDKPEISEPILGPTTSRASTIKPKQNKELTYNFYDVESLSDWTPTATAQPKMDQKWKRQDESKVAGETEDKNIMTSLITTVRMIPLRVAKMIQDAEKYARETVLPLVSTYTPKFIFDFIAPRENSTPKYVPLSLDDSTERVSFTSTTEGKVPTGDLDKVELTTIENSEKATPYTHIQKINRKRDKQETSTDMIEITTHILNVESGRSRDVAIISSSKAPEVTSKNGIYIDLPVFNSSDKEIKYIPLERSETTSDKNR